MHQANLRQVGGSVMMALPPAFLEQLQLKAGAAVGLVLEGQRIVIAPQPKAQPRYSLAELLAASDYNQAKGLQADTDWHNGGAVGAELI